MLQNPAHKYTQTTWTYTSGNTTEPSPQIYLDHEDIHKWECYRTQPTYIPGTCRCAYFNTMDTHPDQTTDLSRKQTKLLWPPRVISPRSQKTVTDGQTWEIQTLGAFLPGWLVWARQAGSMEQVCAVSPARQFRGNFISWACTAELPWAGASLLNLQDA